MGYCYSYRYLSGALGFAAIYFDVCGTSKLKMIRKIFFDLAGKTGKAGQRMEYESCYQPRNDTKPVLSNCKSIELRQRAHGYLPFWTIGTKKGHATNAALPSSEQKETYRRHQHDIPKHITWNPKVRRFSGHQSGYFLIRQQ
jgi:hypothetical protein